MKLLKIGLISLAVSLFVIACSQTKPTDTTPSSNVAVAANANTVAVMPTAEATDELVAVRKIYSEQCVNCHKENGTGGVSTIDGKRIKAPDFTSDRMKRDDEKDWIEAIENGVEEDGMPAYKGKISDADIKNLVRLIRKDFQGKP